MKQIIPFLFLLSCGFANAQTQFKTMPDNAKEIHFTYRVKTNIKFDENGFYADSLLFKVKFPSIKYITNSTVDGKNYNAFIPFTSLNQESTDTLKSILYYENKIIKGIYNRKKEKIMLTVIKADEDIKALFAKQFQLKYKESTFKEVFNLSKKEINRMYPQITVKIPFASVSNTINWETKYEGEFDLIKSNAIYNCKIKTDENLSKYISPGYVFENNNFGVIQVESLLSTIQLESVTYK